ncbi:MAG: hypothetical protein EBZ36_04705 [Acidobacteria bacterium]|nr:hypothetical protein [Acidobacteriota bacterium]
MTVPISSIRVLPLILTTLLTVSFIVAGGQAQSGADAHRTETLYRYFFENERFTTPYQEVMIDGQGKGHYRFKKKDMDELTINFLVSPRVLMEIRSSLEQLSFLGSEQSYQHRKDFSHLGTITLFYQVGGRQRETRFNYTDNQTVNNLVRIFRGLTVQENRIFEIELVRSTDPISMPAQLRLLEGELKSRNVADPGRFSDILKDLARDESVPLIARNHADRLLRMLEQAKQD